MPTKTRSAKSARTRTASKKRATLHARPVHKRVLLHPFSVMVLLCAGVLIIGSTLRSYAADYDVTATVPAELPASPAVIQNMVHEQHVTAQPVTVTGTCPEFSYVVLYRNSTFSGVSQCSANQTFQIQTALTVGANILDPKVYNITNQEGPAGTPITVFYDELVAEPPRLPAPVDASPPTAAEAPVQLAVSTLELSEYARGDIAPVSINPTVTGYAPPFSDITVAFHSEVTYCHTKAGPDGFWSCTLNNILDIGLHRVDIVAKTPSGKRLAFPSFQVRVIKGMASLKQPTPPTPFIISANYLYAANEVGQSYGFSLGMRGGTAPYQLTIDWGDGAETGMSRPDQAGFTISHVYTKPGTYTVLVRGMDANKQTTLLQLVAVVKGDTEIQAGGGFIDNIMGGLKEWLWLVWPVYIGVLLMVLSYWIGEQEAYRQLLAKRRPARASGGRLKR